MRIFRTEPILAVGLPHALLSSGFCKILDYITLERYHYKPISCELLFDFKVDSSANVSSVMLKGILFITFSVEAQVFVSFFVLQRHSTDFLLVACLICVNKVTCIFMNTDLLKMRTNLLLFDD
jgi:hypothetical protein